MNVSEEYLGSESYGNATMLWSTQITDLGTLVGTTWAAAATNSAGDDIITETVGDILDARPLGNYLIVYKSDGVYRVQDTGDPLYLVTELLFEDDGLYSPVCLVDIGGGRHFVAGNYGIYLHDGGPNKENISRGRIEAALFADINTKHTQLSLIHISEPTRPY